MDLIGERAIGLLNDGSVLVEGGWKCGKRWKAKVSREGTRVGVSGESSHQVPARSEPLYL